MDVVSDFVFFLSGNAQQNKIQQNYHQIKNDEIDCSFIQPLIQKTPKLKINLKTICFLLIFNKIPKQFITAKNRKTRQYIPTNQMEQKITQMQKQIQFLKKITVQEYLQDESFDIKEMHDQNVQFEVQTIRQRASYVKNQPIEGNQNRNCTNLPVCICFVLFVTVMFGFAASGWGKENFGKLTTMYDAEGFGCGIKDPLHPEYADYPYGYFVAPEYETLWRTVCVKKCPSSSSDSLQCLPNKYVQSCQQTKSPQSQQVTIYASKVAWNTFCLPLEQALKQQIMETAGQSSLISKFLSVRRAWPIIFASIPFAVLLTVAMMLWIKLTKEWTVYFLLGLAIAACIALGIYMLVMPVASKITSNFNKIIGTTFSISLITFGLILLGGFINNKNRVKLACTITKTSANFISDNRIIAILPLILFIFTIGFLVLAVLEALSYYSMGTIYRHEQELPFQHFIMTWKVKALIALHVVQVIWVVVFFMETNDFLVSGVTVNWYYNPKSRSPANQTDKDIPKVEEPEYYDIFKEDFKQLEAEAQKKYQIQKKLQKEQQKLNQSKAQSEKSQASESEPRSNFQSSLKRYFRYHIGSVAFGSFLQTLFGIVKFLYIILSPEQNDKLKFNITNDLKKGIDLICCFCVNYIFNCINSGTYPYIHLSGNSYCASSIEVLQLKIRDGACAPIITFLGVLFSIIVRVGVTILTVLASYVIVTSVEPFKTEIQDATLFNIIIGAISFTISSFFASFYSDSMEAIYTCYITDSVPLHLFKKMDNRIRRNATLTNIGAKDEDIIPVDIKIFMNEAEKQMRLEKKKEMKNDPKSRAKKMKQLKELNGIKDFVLNSTNLDWHRQKLQQIFFSEENEEQKKDKEPGQKKDAIQMNESKKPQNQKKNNFQTKDSKKPQSSRNKNKK